MPSDSKEVRSKDALEGVQEVFSLVEKLQNILTPEHCPSQSPNKALVSELPALVLELKKERDFYKAEWNRAVTSLEENLKRIGSLTQRGMEAVAK